MQGGGTVANPGPLPEYTGVRGEKNNKAADWCTLQ
jgi:hypothetical protein